MIYNKVFTAALIFCSVCLLVASLYTLQLDMHPLLNMVYAQTTTNTHDVIAQTKQNETTQGGESIPLIRGLHIPAASEHDFGKAFSNFMPYFANDWSGGQDPFYFYVYSAIYDNRPIMGPHHIAVIGITHFKRFDSAELRCVHHSTDIPNGVITKLRMQKNTNGYVMTSKWMQAATFVIWCPIPVEISPKQLHSGSYNIRIQYIYPNSTKHVILSKKTVEFPSKPKVQEKLGLCVCALYKPERQFKELEATPLVEWFEMQLLMGVTHFTMYIHSTSFQTFHILKHYVERGVLTLRSIGPVDDDMYMMPRYTSIADCMYRYMYSHQKVAVLDTDEFIVPMKDMTYWEMITDLAKSYGKPFKGTHFQFQNHFFFTDFNEDQSQPSFSRILRHQYHQGVQPFKGPMKSIQDPGACMIATNHLCMLRSYSHEVWTNASDATSRHYKDCKTSRSGLLCPAMFKNSTKDDTMLRYKERLTPVVSRVLNILNLD